MVNASLFFAHILIVLGFLFLALRNGKGAMQTFIALQAVFANLFVVKQMSLFGFSVTCSDVYAIGGILGMNVLQEYWGKEEARRSIWISFCSLVCFVVMTQVHLGYIPIAGEGTHQAFSVILSSMPRIATSSIVVYFLVQQFDVRFFGWLQRLWSGKVFSLRLAISLAITQLLDTVLFSFFGLYGLVDSIWDVIVLSWLVKCSIIAVSSPLAALSKRWLKDAPI